MVVEFVVQQILVVLPIAFYQQLSSVLGPHPSLTVHTRDVFLFESLEVAFLGRSYENLVKLSCVVEVLQFVMFVSEA